MNLHDADEYCRQKSAPAGSSFYYSILFYPEHLRRDLRALHAFGIELEQIITECSDPGVVRIKFAWWQDEILRLYQNAARHPVSLALAAPVARHHIRQNHLQEIVHNTDQLAGAAQDLFREEAQRLFTLGPGLVWHQSAKICGCEETDVLTLASVIGGLFSRYYMLQQPAHPGLMFATQCTAEERNRQIEHIQQTLARQCEAIPPADQNFLLHIQIMACIIGKSCESIMRNDRFQTLTPLRKLWIAWRTQRRYRKNSLPH